MGGSQSVPSSANSLTGYKPNNKSRNVKYTTTEAGETKNINAKSRTRHSQPIAKKPPPSKRRTNYEELFADSESLSNERYQEKRKQMLNEEPLTEEVNGKEDIGENNREKDVGENKARKNYSKSPPPTENDDIVPLFPKESSTEKKTTDKKSGDKNKTDGDWSDDKKKKTEVASDRPENSKDKEIEYYEHRMEFNDEDSEETDSRDTHDSDSGSDTNSERSGSTERSEVRGKRLGRVYSSSSSSSSTISSASERALSTARSKATEKTLVPTDSDREDIDDEVDKNQKEKRRIEDAERDRLTSHVYVKPEPKPQERRLMENIDPVVEPTPPKDNIFVVHMFEKNKQEKEQKIEQRNDITSKYGNSNDTGAAVKKNHIVKLQLYPGVEYYKTVIRMDKNTEDVSLLKDVFLKDAIITDDD